MRFTTPQANQGQIVIVSYLALTNHVIRETYDRSDMTVAYHISRARKDDDGDYNQLPPKNNKWSRISAEMVGRMMTQEDA